MSHPNQAQYTHKYYLKYKGSGRCTHCLRPAELNKVMCAYS